jgi:hypothetical protein
MQFRLEPSPDHLHVVVEGAFDLGRARAALGDVLREAQARGFTAILVDARGIETRASVADRYELATQLAEHGAGRLRVAIVVAPENMFSKTMEDTARNRGVALLTTDSMPEALAFLGIATS